MMPAIPHISWKRLSVSELKEHYEKDTREYSQEEKDIIITLVHLVEKGEVKAFQRPDGEIIYQYYDPLLREAEGKEGNR